MARLTDERIQKIKATLERDPYANIPDSAFRQAGAFRPKLDEVSVELNRADVRALLADLEEAREHRWLSEGPQRCPTCGMSESHGHVSSCVIADALAATEERCRKCGGTQWLELHEDNPDADLIPCPDCATTEQPS